MFVVEVVRHLLTNGEVLELECIEVSNVSIASNTSEPTSTSTDSLADRKLKNR